MAGALLLANAVVYGAPDGNGATGNVASDIGFRIVEDTNTMRFGRPALYRSGYVRGGWVLRSSGGDFRLFVADSLAHRVASALTAVAWALTAVALDDPSRLTRPASADAKPGRQTHRAPPNERGNGFSRGRANTGVVR